MSDAGGLEKRRGAGRTICGCTAVVFFLSALVALLAAAVVGLAAGTGIEASRATSAQNRADRLNASLVAALGGATATTKSSASTSTSASASASSTSFASLDDNCTGNPDGVTGTTYNAFSLFGDYSFTIQCNKDTDGSPLMSLFAADINGCMDACAAYSHYTPSMFGNNTNTTCGAVSFIPLWTNETAALVGYAPGNCYLKPTQTAAPTTPNIGTECHAGILVTS
ncbi:hypothetical protein M406DRAFT_61351 [Cryphonectria parasitica EP155]|uniref:Uncharacterized protein n=1 Tax=Cryphonectria parasitica (strain ATCC 38755 / EP155) TaxID=660469 RepID=A0A9P4Y6M5_CRYP1|nr:uncharacterized protein M406DRAFT_61351 [Cryphonectria parasitica EP155]KAF3767456.1 hypothetical protein M406DRAFT_61351 [Cryphonectria parasitica EP155]